MLIRWQLAYPSEPVPLIGEWLGEQNAPGGVILPEFFNQLGAMHGTIMVFLGPTQTGDWEIVCSQLCGLGHYRMKGTYSIQTRSDYDAWLKEEASFLGP